MEYQMLEQSRMYSQRDLRDLGAVVLYSTPLPSPLGGMGFVEESFRFDSHDPFGDHLNYEVKVNLSNGRQRTLSNTHIRLEPTSDETELLADLRKRLRKQYPGMIHDDE